MREVESVKQPIKEAPEYSVETKMKLINLGWHDGKAGNFTLNTRPNMAEIEVMAEILSEYHGRLKVYCIWYSYAIDMWRIVFGY